jgi:hypothetical protein
LKTKTEIAQAVLEGEILPPKRGLAVAVKPRVPGKLREPAVPAFKFTDRALSKLLPPDLGRKDYETSDLGMPGLTVRVGRSRARKSGEQRRATIRFFYKNESGRHKIGSFPAITADKARELAKVLAGRAAGGVDLRQERQAKKDDRIQARAAATLTLGKVIGDWEKERTPTSRGGYVTDAAAGLRRVYEPLLNRPVI